MLIPELSDLQQLEDATVTKALAGRSQTNVTKVCLCTGLHGGYRSPIDAFVIVIQT